MTWIYKIITAVSGLFLSLFLLVHLAGNLPLLLEPPLAAEIFNSYAAFMKSNLLITLISYGLYLSLLLHMFFSIFLYLRANKKKEKYKGPYTGAGSTWYSRQMASLGILIAGFLLIHLKDFWYVYVFGSIPLDIHGNKDLYTLVITTFGDGWQLAAYCVGIVALGLHLRHGFTSAFMSLGVHKSGQITAIKTFANIYSIVVSAGFIIIPIYLFIKIKYP